MKSPMGRFGLALLLLAPAARPAAADGADALATAYKREYAFLEAEKKALQRRLKEMQSGSAEKLQQARDEIELLQKKVLALRAEADETEILLQEAGRATANSDRDEDLLRETFERAAESLGRAGFDVAVTADSVETQAELIERIFFHASQLMQRNAQIRREKGAFFLEDGRQTEGELLHFGRVASFGYSQMGSGPLGPAGSNQFKLLPQNEPESALALRQGKAPRKLQLFLYESLEKAVEHKKEKTVLSVIESGGIIGWIIVFIGLVSLGLLLLRSLVLLRADLGSSRLLSRLRSLLAAGRNGEALEVCRRAGTPLGRVLQVTIINIDRQREQLEDLVSEAVLHESPRLERFGATTMVIAAIAPLLGLLGTVTGIITTFDVITEFGTGDPRLLSAGISEALVTTELGLIVAIPTLLIGTLLGGKAGRMIAELEKSALTAVNSAVSPRGGEQGDWGGLPELASAAEGPSASAAPAT